LLQSAIPQAFPGTYACPERCSCICRIALTGAILPAQATSRTAILTQTARIMLSETASSFAGLGKEAGGLRFPASEAATSGVTQRSASKECTEMTDANVTFRVSIDDLQSTDMNKIKSSFESLGFNVETDGKRGFMLTGPKALAEQTFNSKIEDKDGSNSFSSNPLEQKILKNKAHRVYFPRKPEFY
jgi:hypothetical protein